ncbi:hypothetical protein GCM10028808_72920 [Spirosoma migulaei]
MTRFAKLKSYLNADFYYGGAIRWLLVDKNGNSVDCDRCGNIANAILKTTRTLGTYYVPLCKKHFHQTFPDAYQVPDVRVYNKPIRIRKTPLKISLKMKGWHYVNAQKTQKN